MRVKEREDLQIGTTYKVTMEDCCINGEFTAKFLGWRLEDGTIVDTTVDADYAAWDNGVLIGPLWGAWHCDDTNQL